MAGAVIIGAGPGIGTAVARRFAREGVPVAVVARGADTVRAAVAAVGGAGALGLTADAADERALREALDAAGSGLGGLDAVVYNAALVRPDAIGELSAREQADAWAVNVVGALTAAAHALPGMARRGGGSFLVTGGMPQPRPEYVSLSLGKAGVRAAVAMLDEVYGPQGVHVATVTVDGPVAPGTAFDPDAIAEHYWRLHTQPRDRWEREVLFTGDR